MRPWTERAALRRAAVASRRCIASRVRPDVLVGSWAVPGGPSVTVSLTPCIVTCPPGDDVEGLVNPANERLQGTLFTPTECEARLVGGRSRGIIYPPQAIDGLVHEMAGPAMATACAALPEIGPAGVRCHTGEAVVTPAFGELRACYSHVIHAVAPHYDVGDASAVGDDDARRVAWARRLRSAYDAAFGAASAAGLLGLAVPLLGAGARGAACRGRGRRREPEL